MSSAVQEKRYKLSQKEKEIASGYMRIMTDLNIQISGVNELLNGSLAEVRNRLKITSDGLPKNIERQVRFDPATFELVVQDLDHNKLEKVTKS